MDERQKKMLEAYAEFERKMAELKEKQMDTVRSFADRAADKRIKQIRSEIYGYDASGTGDSEPGDN